MRWIEVDLFPQNDLLPFYLGPDVMEVKRNLCNCNQYSLFEKSPRCSGKAHVVLVDDNAEKKIYYCN